MEEVEQQQEAPSRVCPHCENRTLNVARVVATGQPVLVRFGIKHIEKTEDGSTAIGSNGDAFFASAHVCVSCGYVAFFLL